MNRILKRMQKVAADFNPADEEGLSKLELTSWHAYENIMEDEIGSIVEEIGKYVVEFLETNNYTFAGHTTKDIVTHVIDEYIVPLVPSYIDDDTQDTNEVVKYVRKRLIDDFTK